MLVNTGDSWYAQCLRVTGETVWPSCFAGVLSLEQSVNLSFLNGEGSLYGNEGGGSSVGRSGSGQTNCL